VKDFDLTFEDVQTTSELQFQAALTSAALVRESKMGRIMVTGVDRIDLLHRMSTNDLLSARSGQVVGTVFTTEKGRILDYVNVCFLDSSLLLLTSPNMDHQLIKWIEKFHIMEDIQLAVTTNDAPMHTVVGPLAIEAVTNSLHLTIKPNSVVEATTEFGRLIIKCKEEFATTMVHLTETDRSTSLSDRIRLSGKELLRMNEDVFEAFRITRGIPIAGHEISEAFNPYECGLTHAISYTKGCYIGQEVIARLDTYDKIQRSMVGVVFEERLPEMSANSPLKKGEEEVGLLTSVSRVPIWGRYPALAIVKRQSLVAGERFTFTHQDRSFKGVVSFLPIELDWNA
jgi:folate-binding protein YgfZ